jgi:hypothetical protein
MLSGRSVDALDPQRAEFSLADAAIAISVLTGLDDGLFGDAEVFFRRPE